MAMASTAPRSRCVHRPASGPVIAVRSPHPALDMRVFRSSRFNAAVTAGVVFNIVLGGSMVLLAFYLVTIRKESHELFGLLLIPATATAALAAFAAGPAANRFGTRTVLITGLVLMFGGLMVLRNFDLATSRPTVFITTALIVVVITLGPVVYGALGGFRSNEQLASDPAGLPDPWVWSKYSEVFTNPSFWRYALNSMVVATITTAVTVVAGVMAAYPLARYRFRARGRFRARLRRRYRFRSRLRRHRRRQRDRYRHRARAGAPAQATPARDPRRG